MKSLQRKQPRLYPVEKVVIPEVRSSRLSNGIPVYSIEAGTEDIMRMEILFRAGQVRDTLPLLSSTTNMMLTEGSQDHSSNEINTLLDYYGIFLHLFPEKDLAGMVLFFMNKHIEKALELTREILFRPVFPETELHNLMEKRLRWFYVNREKSSTLAIDQFFESAFGKLHPYGRQLVEKDFEMMNRTAIREFHSKYYTPGSMAVIVSGKIHPENAGLLNKYLGEINSGEKISQNELPPIDPGGSKKVHIGKPSAVQTAIRIGSPTINKRHPDYPGLKVLSTLLGGYFGSRLMKNIREEKGFTYGITSSVYSLNLSGYKVISAEVNPKNTRETLDEIYNEIRKLQDVPVSMEELTIVRNYMSGEMVRMFDGPFAVAESFRSAWEFGLDNNYYHRFYDTVNNISPDEIINLARTYYKIDDLYQITVGPG